MQSLYSEETRCCRKAYARSRGSCEVHVRKLLFYLIRPKEVRENPLNCHCMRPQTQPGIKLELKTRKAPTVTRCVCTVVLYKGVRMRGMTKHLSNERSVYVLDMTCIVSETTHYSH